MNEQPVIDYLGERQPTIVDWLKTCLRIPSVSADPAFAPDTAAARELLLARLREIGLSNVRLLDGGGEPAVYGEWKTARPASRR